MLAAIEAKLKVLKELLHQMQCKMDEGLGEDASAGKEAMSQLSDAAEEGGEGLEEKMAEASEEATDGAPDSLEDEKKSFFKRSGKFTPKKATVVVVKGKAPGMAPSKAPSKGKMNRYG